MALTAQQIQEARKKYGIKIPTDSSSTGNGEAPKKATGAELIKQLEAGVPIKNEGVLKTLIKGIGTGVARTGVTAYNFLSGLGNLGQAGYDAITGDKAGAQRNINEANTATHAKRTLPIFGELAPVGDTGNLRTDIKDIIGTGLDVGSLVIGGGEAKAGTELFKDTLKAGVKTGLRTGAVVGGAGSAGRALQEDKGALDVLKETAVGTLGGAAFGGVLGAGGAVLGAGSRAGRTAIDNLIEKSSGFMDTAGNVAKGLAEKAKGGIRSLEGAGKRVEVNAAEKEAARLEYEALPPHIKDAATQGIIPRDAELIAGANPTEKKLFSSLQESAQKFEKDRLQTPPSQLYGEEFAKRTNALKDELEKSSAKLNDIVAKTGNKKIEAGDLADNIINSMKETKGLEGISINPDGTLDFANTTLSSSLTEGDRKVIQKAFDDALKKRDVVQAHKLRQELFEELGGRSKSGMKTTETADQGLEAIRKGLASSIGKVAKGYEEANKDVAQILGIKRQIQNIFGMSKKGNEDIFNMKAGVLLRRLTSNAKSGQDISSVIRDLEGVLASKGIAFDTSLLKTQEFINLLNRYYDIAGDTTLQGILKTSNIPTGTGGMIQQALNQIIDIGKASPETAKEAIKNLLQHVQK